MPEPPDISPEQIAADLAGLMRTGATVAGCRKVRDLTRLTIVEAKAASDRPDDLASSASHLVAEACARVDDIRDGDTAVLLGLANGWRGRLVKERRREVATRRAVSDSQIRQGHEPHMLAAVADEIYAMDAAYRLRHRHRSEIEANPSKSALKIDWLEQHRSYRRLWSPITGLRNDLLVLGGYLQEVRANGRLPRTPRMQAEAMNHGSSSVVEGAPVDEDTWHRISDRCSNLCYHAAKFFLERQRFIEREGGLWLLSDTDSEVRAADAFYRMELHLPLGETDMSALAVLLVETPHEELDPFEERLIHFDGWPILRESWIEWVDAAVAVRELPSGGDGVVTDCAKWLAAGQQFIDLIDADWLRVADWYHRPGRAR